MEHVRLFERPELHSPVLISAFAGWNDAAQSATSAIRFLMRHWSAQKLAEIEPEEFFNFTETRPTVRIVEGSLRKIEWPATELFFHRDPAQGHHYILLVGTEPQLRWRSFVAAILGLCQQFGATTLITLGALLAEVPHSVPTKMLGFANEPALTARLRRLNAQPSQYEGPTGIVGVLNASAGERALRTASIWGSVPMYLSAIPNPRVTLAILRCLDGLLDLSLPLRSLEETGRQFDRQVAEGIANNPEIAAYVHQLEEKERAARPPVEKRTEAAANPPELPSGESLVQDVEEFLRRMRGDGS